MPRHPDAADDRAQLTALRTLQHRALVEQDVDALSGILAPSFEAVHITGTVQTRADWLTAIASGRMRYHSIEPLAVDVRVDQDTAVVTDRSRVTATIYGSQGTWPLESTTTFIRTADGWVATRSVADLF